MTTLHHRASLSLSTVNRDGERERARLLCILSGTTATMATASAERKRSGQASVETEVMEESRSTAASADQL